MATKSVEDLVADIRLLGEARHATVQALRALVGKLVVPLGEEVKYGGILFSCGVPFGGVFAYKDHVSFEFSRGAAIPDRFGHLEGSGKLRRHLKLVSVSALEEKQVCFYIPLAVTAAKNAA